MRIESEKEDGYYKMSIYSLSDEEESYQRMELFWEWKWGVGGRSMQRDVMRRLGWLVYSSNGEPLHFLCLMGLPGCLEK